MAQNKARKAGAQWLREQGPEYPFVLSCRARLIRNIDGLPFPVEAGEEDLMRARGMIFEAVSRRVAHDKDWEMRLAEELSRNQLEMMAEERLTDVSFSNRRQGRAVTLGPDDGRSVVVNEEDHARIQTVLPGAQFMKVYATADDIDNRIESEVKYCFDQRVGYLTSYPGNVGTGLEVSAILHLPALVITGEIGKTISALSQAGIYVRGMDGERAGVAGNLFQIANRQTLGRTEEFITTNMDMIARQVADNEKTARKMMIREDSLDLADRAHRALGVVERCRRVCYYEALELISLMKLGVDTGVLPVGDFNPLSVGMEIGSYHLLELLGAETVEVDIDRERAVQLRRILDL